ncbi:phage nozzle protein [Nitrobacteraceae bacterium UC4449_H16]
MKVDGSLGSLMQGVSQQSPRDRFDGQCSLQENMSADAVNGLTRRPPTDLVGYLGSASTVLGWYNFKTRDGNKFLAMFKDGEVGVFDLNASPRTCTVDVDAVAYLSATDNMKCSTDDEDNTVVVNPKRTVAMKASTTEYFNTAGTPAAIFQVLGGAYSKLYTIVIDGVIVSSYLTSNGAAPTDARSISTEYIAEMLLLGLLNNTGTVPGSIGNGDEKYGSGYCAGWSYNLKGDIFWIKAPAPGSFSCIVSDGVGGVNIKCCTDTATNVADLPRIAPHYYAVRIAENSDAQKDLWFKFIVSSSEDYHHPDSDVFGNSGYWKEAVAPNTDTEFDAATMPHKLTYSAPNFTFSREAYIPRNVGTEVSNPDPSFVGNTINDVASFQGRCVFLSGSNVIMSRTNRSTNFWQGSASALAETDPIDINSTVESSQMLAAVQHNKDLAVFTPKAQFTVYGRNALTPQNASLVLTTRFESELQAHPVGAGRNVFFAANFGRFTDVREFFAEDASDSNDSRPVTQHVNKYLLGKARLLTSSANYQMLMVHTDASQTDAYVYQYIWNDEKKIQSAWSTWKFDNDIVHSFFDEDVLYLVQRLGNEHYLLRMPLDVQDSDDVGYPVFVDQRFDVLDCYQSFELPYNYLADIDKLVCVQGSNCPTPGLTVAIDSIVGSVVTLKKNMLGGDLVIGTRFMSRYIPTPPSVKDQNGVTVSTSKLRARAFLVSLSETGEIKGRVRSKYGDGPEIKFNARIVGDVDNIIGVQPLSDGRFTMPFRYNVNDADIELYSDSHLPMTLSDIEYVGQYSKRGQRIANQGGTQ